MSNCVKCKNPAELMCSRCFDPYCGVKCQLIDWIDHKLICQPMPGLVTIDALMHSANAAAAAKSKKADVSHERDIIHESSPKVAEADVLPKKHSVPMNAMLKNINRSTTAEVHVNPELSPMPPSKPIKTKTPPSRKPSMDEQLSELISAKPGLTLSEEKTKPSNNEESTNSSNPFVTSSKVPQSIVSKLRPLVESSPKTQYFLSDLKTVPLQEGKNVPLLITDTSLLKQFIISALDYENKARKDINRNMRKLAEYCKVAGQNKTGYDPQANELCLAIFDEDGEWYRAFVIEEKPGGGIYIVQFVDYGNIAEVSRTNIIPITEELMFPTCTNMCVLKKINESDLKKFAEYIDSNAVIQCDVRYNKSADVYEVALANVNAVLK